jgi:hypothetical protein
VLLAVAFSVADLLVRVARPHDAVLSRVPGLAGMHDLDDYPGAKTAPGLVVYRYDARRFSPTPRTSGAAPAAYFPSCAFLAGEPVDDRHHSSHSGGQAHRDWDEVLVV